MTNGNVWKYRCLYRCLLRKWFLRKYLPCYPLPAPTGTSSFFSMSICTRVQTCFHVLRSLDCILIEQNMTIIVLNVEKQNMTIKIVIRRMCHLFACFNKTIYLARRIIKPIPYYRYLNHLIKVLLFDNHVPLPIFGGTIH